MNNEFKGLRFHTMALPHIPVGHPDYVWRGAADTDVQRTWRAYGWKSHEEQQALARGKKFAPVKVLRQM